MKTIDFAREIVSEECKNAKFSACGGLKPTKEYKTVSQPAAGAENFGGQNSLIRIPPLLGTKNFKGGGILK